MLSSVSGIPCGSCGFGFCHHFYLWPLLSLLHFLLTNSLSTSVYKLVQLLKEECFQICTVSQSFFWFTDVFDRQQCVSLWCFTWCVDTLWNDATNSHTHHFTLSPVWWYVTGHAWTLELQTMFIFQSRTSVYLSPPCSTWTLLWQPPFSLGFLKFSSYRWRCSGDYAVLVFLPGSVHAYGTQGSVCVLAHHRISLFSHLANILWFVFLLLLGKFRLILCLCCWE